MHAVYYPHLSNVQFWCVILLNFSASEVMTSWRFTNMLIIIIIIIIIIILLCVSLF